MNFLRKSSKKDLVKEIHITSKITAANERCTTFATDDNCQLNLHQPEPAVCNINALRVRLKKTENELQRLKAENERLGRSRVSLEDRANYFEKMCNEKEAEILSLSTKIEILKLQNSELKSEQSNEMYKVKTQHMTLSSLEEELKRVKEESTKMVHQLQKKINRLQENHAKSKQDYALKVFVLKDEKKKLAEENEALEDRLRYYKTEGSQNFGQDDEPSSTPRNQLVIQLSQQVTMLDVENQELTRELETTKRLLQKFESKQEVRSKSRTKCEKLCVNVASLHLSNSTSKVELLG